MYSRIVEVSDEQQTKIYLDCTKEQLAKMLVECNKHLKRYKRNSEVTETANDQLTKNVNQLKAELKEAKKDYNLIKDKYIRQQETIETLKQNT